MTLLLSLSIAFHIWMIVDAIRRRVELFWFVILLLPFGAFVYFFFVKLGLVEKLDVSPVRPSPASLSARIERLAVEEEQSPSFANRIRLARTLFEAERFGEAAEFYSRALSTHTKDKEALYGLGRSQLELGHLDEAVKTLSRLVDTAFAYDDFNAARTLVQALWQSGRHQEAFDLLEEIKERSPGLRHRVTLAHYLIEAGLKDEAVRVLDEALARFERASDFIRKREGRWATEARGILRNLTS